MFKYILALISSVVVIAGGITAYYFFVKPKKEVVNFATEYEKILNERFINARNSIETNYNIRNMVKFRAKEAKCEPKNRKVICNIDRIYIGGPFASFDAKNNKIIVIFKDDNTLITDIDIKGIFETEQSVFTNLFSTDSGLNCRVKSKYNKENGIFYNKYENCHGNFGEIFFNTFLDYSYKSIEIKNKNIYDALLIYYKPFNMEEVLDNRINSLEISINHADFNISSDLGLFNAVYGYIKQISKREISQEKFINTYKKLSKEEENINADNVYKSLLQQLFKAFDSIILNNHKSLNIKITQQKQGVFYNYNSIESMEKFFKDLIIKIESNN